MSGVMIGSPCSISLTGTGAPVKAFFPFQVRDVLNFSGVEVGFVFFARDEVDDASRFMFSKVIIRTPPVLADSVIVEGSFRDGPKVADLRVIVLDEEIVDQIGRLRSGRDATQDLEA